MSHQVMVIAFSQVSALHMINITFSFLYTDIDSEENMGQAANDDQLCYCNAVITNDPHTEDPSLPLLAMVLCKPCYKGREDFERDQLLNDVGMGAFF